MIDDGVERAGGWTNERERYRTKDVIANHTTHARLGAFSILHSLHKYSSKKDKDQRGHCFTLRRSIVSNTLGRRIVSNRRCMRF
jgi:hypothetical protein